LGKELSRSTKGNQDLVDDLLNIGKVYEQEKGISVISGKTLCAHDFYEGQGRLDGAFCEYTMENKFEFLNQCYEHNVKNIEMESLCFFGLLNHAKIRAGVVCVTLVDRLNGDQVSISHDLNVEFQERPFKLVADYIKSKMN
jgi:uridine phosphorylase